MQNMELFIYHGRGAVQYLPKRDPGHPDQSLLEASSTKVLPQDDANILWTCDEDDG